MKRRIISKAIIVIALVLAVLSGGNIRAFAAENHSVKVKTAETQVYSESSYASYPDITSPSYGDELDATKKITFKYRVSGSKPRKVLYSLRDLTTDTLHVSRVSASKPGSRRSISITLKNGYVEGHDYRFAVCTIGRDGKEHWDEVEFSISSYEYEMAYMQEGTEGTGIIIEVYGEPEARLDSYDTYFTNVKQILNAIKDGSYAQYSIGEYAAPKVWNWYNSSNGRGITYASNTAWCAAFAGNIMYNAGYDVFGMAKADMAEHEWGVTGVRNYLDTFMDKKSFHPCVRYTSDYYSGIRSGLSLADLNKVKTGDIVIIDNGNTYYGHMGLMLVTNDGYYVIHGNCGNRIAMNRIYVENDGQLYLTGSMKITGIGSMSEFMASAA